jgi:hypothetical protein
MSEPIHHELPERLEVRVEKIKLFPSGGPKLVFVGTIGGYAIDRALCEDGPRHGN